MAALVCTAAVATPVFNPSIFLMYCCLSTFKQVVTEKAQIDGTFETRVPRRNSQYVDTRHRPAKTGFLGLLQ